MTPTDTVVSDEKLELLVRTCTDMGDAGEERRYTWWDDLAGALRELLDRRTATPQSGGVVVKGLEWEGDRSKSVVGTYATVRTPDGYAVTFDGEEIAHIGHNSVSAFEGARNAAQSHAQADYEARIRSTLADPIPEAPADEEVEGLAQALRNLAEGAEQEDRTILYKAAAALRRSTETDKPGVREAALEEAAKVAEACDTLGLHSFKDHELTSTGIAARDKVRQIAAAIRALSASPLTEEQPAAKFKRGDRVQKIKGSAWRGHVVGTYSTGLTPEGYNVESENEPGSVQLYPAAALETLPRSTTGGAK